MARFRRAAVLATVALGTLAPALLAAEATLDAVPDPLSAVATATVTLDGAPLAVRALGELVPPSVVAVAIDPVGLAPEVRRTVLAAAARQAAVEGGPLVVAAEIGDGLAVRLPASRPGQGAEAALARLGEPPSAHSPPHDDDAILAAIAELAGGGGTSTSMVEVQALLRRVEAEVSRRRLATLRRIAAVDELVVDLAAAPGRKTLVLVAGALDTQPGRRLAAAWNEAFPDAPSRTLDALAAASGEVASALDELADHAVARRVALYPVAVVGPEGERLAARTGGRVVDAASLAAAAEAARELSVELPRAAPDDARLTVRFGDHEARAPRRLATADPAELAADRAVGAARLGVAHNPLQLEVSSRPTRQREDGSRVVPLVVSVPIVRLSLADADDGGRVGRVAIFTAAADQRRADRHDFPITITPDTITQAMAGRAGFVVGVELPPGEQLVAVGLLDTIGGGSSTALVRLAVE